jgi:hypothetical protein
MKPKIPWLSALTLAVTMASHVEIMAATNGMIIITTRLEQDLTWGSTDSGNIMGPGQAAQGDVAMETILADHGYSCRFLIDAELNPTKINAFTTLAGDQNFYLFPANVDFTAMLVINSGTSGSANIGAPNTNDIPIIMGEHSCISDVVRAAHNSLYLYSGAGSDDVKNDEPSQGGTNQYMKVLLPNHPIMQGIPLDAQGMVKIFRDPYPEEGGIPGGVGPVGSHTPPGGKKNYEFAWTTINASQAAAGTQVIGVLGNYPERACFATAGIGAQLASTANDPDHPWQVQFHDNVAHQRLVHWFINDQGSGGSRRCFNSLTDLGRVIFIRTVKWALGEPLTPYQPLGLIRVSKVGQQQIRLEWNGLASKNYKILGTRNLFGPPDFSNWQTVAQDIPGSNGTISATFDVSHAVQYAYLRVMPVP